MAGLTIVIRFHFPYEHQTDQVFDMANRTDAKSTLEVSPPCDVLDDGCGSRIESARKHEFEPFRCSRMLSAEEENQVDTMYDQNSEPWFGFTRKKSFTPWLDVISRFRKFLGPYPGQGYTVALLDETFYSPTRTTHANHSKLTRMNLQHDRLWSAQNPGGGCRVVYSQNMFDPEALLDTHFGHGSALIVIFRWLAPNVQFVVLRVYHKHTKFNISRTADAILLGLEHVHNKLKYSFNISHVQIGVIDNVAHPNPVTPARLHGRLKRAVEDLRVDGIGITTTAGNGCVPGQGVNFPSSDIGVPVCTQRKTCTCFPNSTDNSGVVSTHGGVFFHIEGCGPNLYSSGCNSLFTALTILTRQLIDRTGFPWVRFGSTIWETIVNVFRKTSDKWTSKQNTTHLSVNLTAAWSFIVSFADKKL